MEASFRIFFSLLEVGSIQCLNFTFRAPDYFNEGWMAKIKLDEVTNWRLKVHTCMQGYHIVKVLQLCKKCLVAFEDQENNTQKSYHVNIMIMHLSWYGTSYDIYVDRSAL